GLQSLERLAHRCPAHLEHRGQVALRRQPLVGYELAKGDGGHDPLGDALARCRHRDRREVLGHLAGPVPARLADPAKKPAMTLASAWARVTILASSTASSTAWMLRARGP